MHQEQTQRRDVLDNFTEVSRGENGLAGVETLALVTITLLFFVTGIISILRIGLTKLALMDSTSALSRSLALSLGSDQVDQNLNQHYLTQNWLGEGVTISVSGIAQACSTITVRAQTNVNLLPWSLFGGATSISVSSLSAAPTDAYLLPSNGVPCAP
jgi:hypothetical protein